MFPVFIILLFTIFFIKDFKKTFIVMMVISPLLSCFKGVTGIPFNLFHCISLIAFLFSYKYMKWGRMMKSLNVIMLGVVAISASLIISNIYGAVRHTPMMMVNIIILMNLIIFYYIVHEEKRYVKFFLKTCFVFGAFIGIYALFETVTRYNPYIKLVNNIGLYKSDVYVTEVRFFLKRSQSFFSMHTTSGAVSLVLAFVILYMRKYTGLESSGKSRIIVTLLILSVLFTGARSIIAGLCVSMLAYVDFRHVKKLFAPILFLAVIGLVFSDYVTEIVNSFSNTESVSGSNTDMRDTQFQLSLYYLMKSPIVGNGLSYTWDHVAVFHGEELLGAESLWFPIMIDRGLIGISAYIIFFICMLVYTIKGGQTRLCFLVFGALVYNTLSSIPDFDITYLAVYIIPLAEWNKRVKNSLPKARCKTYTI